ncbi:MAG: UDP-N-acetylmuramate--L-alanine ligase [bacterium]|nr:UDP-N-acetylmuramate--L-alanine ligase [bacterium]
MLRNKNKRTHFVGIGGIGMSGIAFILSEMGYKVSGSDLEPNGLTGKIEDNGGVVFKGHASSNILDDVGLLVYSSSVSSDNPEIVEAAKRRIPVVHRSEVLGRIFNRKEGIAVTGTHGKTTTTSLISVLLENCGLDPTAVIGGEVKIFHGNAKLGRGPHVVAEADESDGSFLRLKPRFAVITNIEPEHLDHYKTMGCVKASYRAFADNIKRGGTLFYNNDDLNIKEALKGFRLKKESFGFSSSSDMYAASIKIGGFKASFDCIYKGANLGRVELSIPGRHNVLNAMAAILVGLSLGLDFKKIAAAIKYFAGAKRRFHLRAEAGGVTLIDDYAHHPTEIKAVLDVCANCEKKRLIVIFQPHRYTRTKFLAEEFGRCFNGADKLILTDIYAASERPIRGVSVRSIYDRVRANGVKDVKVIERDKIAGHVMDLKKRGDMVVVLGAGDINKVADDLSSRLNEEGAREDLISGLRRITRGKIRVGEGLSSHTSFKIGGPAEAWVEPCDTNDLKRVLAYAKAGSVPVFIIGNGTNILANDSGFKGIVIRLTSPAFQRLEVKGSKILVGAGYSLPRLVRFCCVSGLSGIESLVGIPGTVGGAIYMNAGGSANPIYKNIGDIIRSLKVMDYYGKIKTMSRKDIIFSYRDSNLGSYVILEAELGLEQGSSALLISTCSKFLAIKREKQVLDMPSAGCVFKNPKDFQFTCGQLIDTLGLKGMRMGGARISEKHANFIINEKGAKSSDVLNLINFIRDKVRENYNVDLELEVKII